MTEDDAQSWLLSTFGGIKFTALEHFTKLLILENARQNLVAPSTLQSIWSRHIVDSAQLMLLVHQGWRHWLDIGSGAGLPGMIVAILSGATTTLVEPRRLRADFLRSSANDLRLSNVRVQQAKAENVVMDEPADVISARAVASLDKLLRLGSRLGDDPRFVLPRGSQAEHEVSMVRQTWHGTFHVKQSIVDATSGIVVANSVRPR